MSIYAITQYLLDAGCSPYGIAQILKVYVSMAKHGKVAVTVED